MEPASPILRQEAIPLLLKRLDDLDSRISDGDSNAYEAFLQISSNYPRLNLDHISMQKLDRQGTNISYVTLDVADKGSKTGIFKPIKGERLIYFTIPKATAPERQIVAYLLDRKYGGKAGVALSVKATTTKDGPGVLQVFKENNGSLADLALSEQLTIPIQALHFLTIQRGRLYELDGNLENVLWRFNEEGIIELISIDHDCILPIFQTKSDIAFDRLALEWSLLPQLEEPFDASAKKYTYNLDLHHDTQLLKDHYFAPEAQDLLKATTRFFQMGAEADLTPGVIVDYLGSAEFCDAFITNRQMFRKDFEMTLKSTFAPKIARLKKEDLDKKSLLQNCLKLIQEEKPEEASQLAVKLVKEYSPKDSRKALMVYDELLKQSATKEALLLKTAINRHANDYSTLNRLRMIEEFHAQAAR